MKEFKVKDAEDFKRFLMEKAPKGYLVYLRTLKASFNIAKNWDWISENPFTKIKFGRIQQVKPKFITRKELDLILQNVKSEELSNIFLFGWYTGCRLNEIVTIKYKNIDLSNRTIIIGDESFKSKNGKSRTIPISNELYVNVFERINIEDKESYVFTKQNGFPFNRDYVSRSFLHARRNAGLSEDIHFHTLRHSFASHLALKGVPITVIKELLGHSSIAVTQIYSHTNLASLKSAIQKFDELIPVV
jgi:integrase